MSRRLRPGGCATLALLFGVFGIASGSEAAYYTVTQGPSGDDFTGLLAIAAGLTLIGWGVVTLWRTRRTDGRHWRRWARRAAVPTVVGLAIASQVMLPIAIAEVGTHVQRATVPRPALGVAHENVAFTTADGLRLHGWFVPSRNGATVIVFPGRTGSAENTRGCSSRSRATLRAGVAAQSRRSEPRRPRPSGPGPGHTQACRTVPPPRAYRLRYRPQRNRGADGGVRDREARRLLRGDLRGPQSRDRAGAAAVAPLRAPLGRGNAWRAGQLSAQHERRHRANSSMTLRDYLLGRWLPAKEPTLAPSPLAWSTISRHIAT